MCLSSVLRPPPPPPAIWSPNPCLPPDPRHSAPTKPRMFTTKPPQAHQDPSHTHIPSPTEIVSNAKYAMGTSMRRIKATRLICRLKFCGCPMPSITGPHRIIRTTGDLKHGTGTWAAPAGPRGGLTTNAQRGAAYQPAEIPQSRRENRRCVCLCSPGLPGQMVA